MARSQGAFQQVEARSNDALPRSQPPSPTPPAPAQTEPKPKSRLTYGTAALLTLSLLLILGWISVLGWLVVRYVQSLLS